MIAATPAARPAPWEGNPALLATAGLCFAGAEEGGQEGACTEDPASAPSGAQQTSAEPEL